MKNLKLLAITILLPAFAVMKTNAQSLPNLQKVSLRAPADIKIDGKATEWNNQLQAHNNATDLFYTLSNDDDNLYLTVQANSPRIIEKIIAVGVTLTVNNMGKKNDKATENRSVTFPVLEVQYGTRIISAMRIKTINISPKQMLKGNEFYTSAEVDSLTAVANKLLIVNSKTFKLKNVTEIPDTLLSVYNEQRIRAAAKFDIKGVYTYELAVPLKYFGLSVDKQQKFSYGLKLNSRLDEGKQGTMMVYRYNGTGEYDANQDLDSTTDFWAEYTLAKK